MDLLNAKLNILSKQTMIFFFFFFVFLKYMCYVLFRKLKVAAVFY